MFFMYGFFTCFLIQVHWEMPTPVGVGNPQAPLNCTRPFLILVFLQVGEVFRVERKFSDSEAAFPDSCLASRSLSPNSDWLYKGQQGFTPTLIVSIFLSVPFCRKRGGESVARDLPPQGTLEEGECQWTERVKSPLGLASFFLT